MFFYNTETKEFPIFLGDAQVANPEWDGDIENPPTPLVWVADAAPDQVENKVIEDAEPQLVDGVWTRQFTYRDLTADELARINAPASARAKLAALGFSEAEIEALAYGALR
jgi:hypothetical protein